MPTQEYISELQPKFGVKKQHDRNIYGQNTSIYIIDTGLAKVNLDNANVIQRSFAGSPGSKQNHGHFVASIVSAPQNDFGIVGIAPKAKVYLADVDNSKGIIYTSQLVSAINDAINLNVDIISISLGTPEQDSSLEDAVRRASQKGILVFAASGNCNCRAYEQPAACEDAIAVASVNLDKAPSVFNTRNDNVSVFAPGENITVAQPLNGSLQKVSGTSFACPFAAALASLILSTMRAEEPTRGLFRVSKSSMISLLRNTDHLGLSCNVHNQTRPNGCSVAGLSDATVPILKNSMFRMALQELSSASSTTLALVIGAIVLLVFLSLYIMKV